MFRVASAVGAGPWTEPGRPGGVRDPRRTAAVCGALSLGILLLAAGAPPQGAPPEVVPAEDSAAQKGPTTLGIRTTEAPGYHLRQRPKPWETSTDQIDIDTEPPPGPLPSDAFAELVPASRRELVPAQPTRGWGQVSLAWMPSEIVHYPLYFDDQALERYGQTVCPAIQPILSGAYFFGTFPIVPYKIGLDRTHDCVSTAGYVRAGNCAPPVCERLPLELDAALFESGTWVGFLFLFP
jgi:hypothetical protein